MKVSAAVFRRFFLLLFILLQQQQEVHPSAAGRGPAITVNWRTNRMQLKTKTTHIIQAAMQMMN
jgi:hypothetical protein